MVKTGQVWTGNFVTLDATGALAAASVGPAGVLYVAGVATLDVVTISGANPYKFSVTLPALTAGQSVGLYVTATVATIATASVVAEDVADTKLVSDLNDAATAPSAADNATAAAAAILVTPANKLGTDAAGRVEVSGATNTLDSLLTALQGAGWTDETLVALGALLDAIKAKTDGLPASPAAVGSAMTLTAAYEAAKTAAQAGDAMTLDAAALTAIGARVIEGTHTQDDVLRLVLALMSKVDGAGTGTGILTYRDSLDTKDRIVQTVDESGNRSAVTLDGTL